jgi:hypothetical protein
MPEQTTIKVRSQVRDRLARQARRRQVTMGELLERLADALEDEEFFARMEVELTRLRTENPQEWRSYLAEAEEWELGTMQDEYGDEDE